VSPDNRQTLLQSCGAAQNAASLHSPTGCGTLRAKSQGGSLAVDADARLAPDPRASRKNPFRNRWSDPASVVARASDVRKAFKASAFSLDPVSIDLRIGEITGVVGRNASGKTTLLRILIGDLAPDAGEMTYPALVGGQKRKRDWATIKRQIAHIPQSADKWRGMLRSSLNFIAATHVAKGQNVNALVDGLVARYAMTRYEFATWDEISGGYKTRFELVRSLAQQPKLLVLDEPLAHLDVVARQRFLSDLKGIARDPDNPIPVVVTSQHLSEIEAIADQMVLLDGGALRYAGSLAGIAEQAPAFMLEVSLDAERDEAERAVEGLGALRVEPTMEGFIFTFPKTVDTGQILQRLHAAFGRRLTAWRDITGSTRSLMTEDEP
jgi:ABC-2 type transport system ATP-binding protein